MQIVPVTLRSRTPRVPAFDTQGYAPSEASSLAVTAYALWDIHRKAWSVAGSDDPGYIIVHRPTGFYLGDGLAQGEAESRACVFDTMADAWAALLRSQPDFPAWPLAGTNEQAREACKVIWRGARLTA